MRRLLSGAAVLGVSLVLFACGDDDDDASNSGGLTTGDISVEEFLADANALCAEDHDETATALNAAYRDAGVNDGSRLPEEEQVQIIEDVLLPRAADTLSALRALEVPEGHDGRISELYDGIEKMQEELAADPAAFFDNRTSPTERNYAINASDYGLRCP